MEDERKYEHDSLSLYIYEPIESIVIKILTPMADTEKFLAWRYSSCLVGDSEVTRRDYENSFLAMDFFSRD